MAMPKRYEGRSKAELAAEESAVKESVRAGLNRRLMDAIPPGRANARGVASLIRKSGLPMQFVASRIKELYETGQVERVGDGDKSRFRYYVPNGRAKTESVPPEPETEASQPQTPTGQVLAALSEQEDEAKTVREIAGETGLSDASVKHIVRRLWSRGGIGRVGEGKRRAPYRYFITDEFDGDDEPTPAGAAPVAAADDEPKEPEPAAPAGADLYDRVLEDLDVRTRRLAEAMIACANAREAIERLKEVWG